LLAAIVFPAHALAAPDKSPAYYLGHFAAGEKVLWLGEVVDVNVYQEQNTTVIEWLCKYLELAEPIDIDQFVKRENLMKKKKTPIKVRKTEEQYFVSVLRSPDMPIEGAREAAAEMVKTKHFAIREAETDFVGEFKGLPVIYIGGGMGTVANNLKVIYVK